MRPAMPEHPYQVGALSSSRFSALRLRSDHPHILILSVSIGTGHLRAAEALELALRQLAPHSIVKNVDVLTLATRPFR
jgi:hypothetical protein